MDVNYRSNCIALGVPLAVIGGGWWFACLFLAHAEGAFTTYGPLVFVPLLMPAGVLHAGLFLCVKATIDPPQFWAETVRHLAMTAGLAGGLCFFLFMTFLLIPK